MIAKRMLMLGSALGALVAAGLAHGQAFNANPKTTAGIVFYDRATPNVETVRVETDTAIVTWTPTAGAFLPNGNTATFMNGPNNVDFVVLNRIVSNTPVLFDGHVISQLIDPLNGTARIGGTVLFSSPGGIIIGPNGLFDIGNLVLTSLEVLDDGAGNFYDAASQGYRLQQAGGVPPSGVVTQPGAQINALGEGSYVAMLGPQLLHGGGVRVNGSAAYVAARQVQLRVNQGLFDIIVDLGTPGVQPLIHTGSTTGPASTGAGDVHAIYMVAVPDAVAITAFLQGNVGFDPPLGAGIENGVVVLSAGFNVAGGAVDRFGDFSPPPVPGVGASFLIGGGRITSDLFGFAVTDMLAGNAVGGNLIFSQDVSLFAGRRAHLFAGAAGVTVTVGGNALVSTAETRAADGSVDHQGGDSAIFISKGGSIAIAGNATVDASAQGQVSVVLNQAGTGTGGTASIFGDGGTITIGGNAAIRATGAGGVIDFAPNSGGTGQGGTALLDGQAGSTIAIAGSLAMDASGTGSRINGAMPIPGAAGNGGTVTLSASGGGAVSVAGPAALTSNGRGGEVLAGTSAAGAGRGGPINLLAGGTLALNGPVALVANAQGGRGPIGGQALAGRITIQAAAGQIAFAGAIDADADATGGDALPGGVGGDATGGTVAIRALSGAAPGRITGGAVDVSANATGGKGGNFLVGVPSEQGGAGQGGNVAITAEAANGTLQLGAVTVDANGTGGTGGDADQPSGGGLGGDGTGGEVQLGTVAGPAAPTLTGGASFASVGANAAGTGGSGGLGGGGGGDGTGGTASLLAAGVTTQIAGATALGANGDGGAGGVPGLGGGPAGALGLGDGGTLILAAGPGGTLAAADVAGTASATGLTGTGNSPGEWHVTADAGGAVNLANLTLTAAATGAPATRPFSSLEPNGGTLNVAQIAQLTTPGEIRVLANGAGRIIGGRLTLAAGDSLNLSHAAPAALTIDVVDLFGTAGAAFGAGAGVVTRSADETDIRALGNANVAGRIEGRAILLRSAALDVAATGAIGASATQTVDAQATGNAGVAGRVLGGDILLSAATVNLAGTGAVGDAATTRADLRATGAMTADGRVLGRTILINAGSLGQSAAGAIGSAAGTDLADIRTTGNAALAGQLLGRAIVLRAAALNLAAGGAIGASTGATVDLQATGNAAVAGQVLGGDILLSAATVNLAGTGAVGDAATTRADLRATGAMTADGRVLGRTILINAGSLGQSAAGAIGSAAGTDLADIRVGGNAALAGQVQGRNLQVASSDIDLTGALGDAGTQIVSLLPNPTGITAVIGGAVQDTGYTLTNAEAGRIRAGTLRILPPAATGLSLLVRDLTLAATNVGRLEIDTPGAARVEGALAMTNAGAANGISFTARQRIEVLTPAGSVRVRDAAGAPGGTLLLASNNIWIVPQPVLALLNADPNYAGRDADLLSNEGAVEPRGYVEAGAVELATGGTLFVQNSGATFTQGFGGVTVGPGGLIVRPTGANPAVVAAFGRRLNGDGTFFAGTPFFFQVNFQPGQASYTGASNFNTCIIVTRQCGGGGGSGPQGPDPITGPVGGSEAILLPVLGEEDDLVDTSFSADPLIEEPVTSGGEAILWDCDDDDDGDCDDRD